MNTYNIVIRDTYAKNALCGYLKENYIYYHTSGYYDNGYYIGIECTPETAEEIDRFLGSDIWDT